MNYVSSILARSSTGILDTDQRPRNKSLRLLNQIPSNCIEDQTKTLAPETYRKSNLPARYIEKHSIELYNFCYTLVLFVPSYNSKLYPCNFKRLKEDLTNST
jgi:hypothetical protein